MVEAYEQLAAEGYLVAVVGSGTRVAADAGRRGDEGSGLEGQAREGLPSVAEPRARHHLRPGLPDLASFPRRRWAAALTDTLRELPDERLSYGDPRGAVELREALAGYLGRARGVSSGPDRIVLTGGLRTGLSLLWGALAGRGLRRVGIEQPGWPGQGATVLAAGLEAVPVAVDGEGLMVDELERADVDAVVVTPANQFPTGAVLAPERRAALVAWARREGALIVEDDYDAQYRYDRDPVGSLQGLAPDRTVHGGSVSKLLAPGLAIGWLVLPERLAGPVAEHKRRSQGAGSVIEQVALARLIDSGELDRHLRRTRRLYRGRREAVLAALARELPEARVSGAAAGLHVVVLLPSECDEQAVVTEAARRGLVLEAMRAREPAVLLGYGRLPGGERGARGARARRGGPKRPDRRLGRGFLWSAAGLAAAAALVAVLFDLARQVLGQQVDRVGHVGRALAGAERDSLEVQGRLCDLRILDGRIAFLPELDLELCERRDLAGDLLELLLDV